VPQQVGGGGHSQLAHWSLGISCRGFHRGGNPTAPGQPSPSHDRRVVVHHRGCARLVYGQHPNASVSFCRLILPLGLTHQAQQAPKFAIGIGEPGVIHGQ
jgi:hypothetical protein